MKPLYSENSIIRLRALEPEDLEILYSWENDPSVGAISNTLAPFSRYTLEQYILDSQRDIYETRQIRLIIETHEGQAIGAVDLFDFDPFHQRAGVGILIHEPANRQKGYAANALELISDYAEQVLGLHQLFANIGANNTASIGLFEKTGFIHCGTKKDWIIVKT
mgnify:CR=1 FL=1